MATYCPDFGQAAPDRLFGTCRIWRNSFSLCWRSSRNCVAREQLDRLNVSPAQNSGIALVQPGECSIADAYGEPAYHCLIDAEAFWKIQAADLTAHRV